MRLAHQQEITYKFLEGGKVEKVKNQYEIDGNYLMEKVRGDEIEAIKGLCNAVRAIFYFLKVGQFKIHEDLYNSINQKDQWMFKKV